MLRTGMLLAAMLLLSGCALTPRGYDHERAEMRAAGQAFRRQAAEAPLPSAVDADDSRALLRRALLANGDVRAAWADWRAAVERVPAASAWPNSNIMLGYSALFSDGNVKAFNRMSFQANFNSAENLSFPGKTIVAGRVALADAEASGERFRATKFMVQRQVLDAWLDLALAAEEERLATQRGELASAGRDAADAALRTGAGQGQAWTARIATARSDDDVATATARARAAQSILAGLTATASVQDIGMPQRLPLARELPADDASLLDAIADSPSVKQRKADRRARDHEEDLAKLEWVPDVNPFAAVTGSIEQGVGLAVMLPTTVIEIRAGIAAAAALRKGARQRLLQTQRDQRGQLQALLVSAADNQRARRLLESRILPAAAAAAASTESDYRNAGQLAAAIDANLLLVDIRMEIATAIIAREKNLTAIEELLGADLETFQDQKIVALPTETTRLATIRATENNR